MGSARPRLSNAVSLVPPPARAMTLSAPPVEPREDSEPVRGPRALRLASRKAAGGHWFAGWRSGQVRVRRECLQPRRGAAARQQPVQRAATARLRRSRQNGLAPALVPLLLVVLGGALCGTAAQAQESFASVIDRVQPKIVKIYGAGGIQGLEHYQSGFLVSPDGHVLTVWSYVLDSEEVIVTLHDGKRYTATLLGADPRLEIAILKIDAAELPCFDLAQSVKLESGDRVLAFSNLFNVATGDEPASVLHGIVATTGSLSARKGVYQTTYRGEVLVLDAMTNNPGAAGGALTNRRGQLGGMLGKELRNAQDNAWLNYAVPTSILQAAVNDLMSGKFRPRRAEDVRKPREPVTLALLGIVLIPNVLVKTPPFIDAVQPGSPAVKAGLKPDDLILFVNDRIVPSAQSLREELSLIDRIDEIRLVVQRGQELINVSLFAPDR